MKAFCVLLTAMLVTPRTVWADPPPPAPLTPIPPGPDVIDVVKKGEAAPHDGQLFDQPTALRWANYLQQCHFRLGLDVQYQYRLDQVDVQLLQKKLDLERAEYARVTTDLQNKLVDAQKNEASPPFYRTFWFGMAVGVVASVALVAGSVAVLNATR